MVVDGGIDHADQQFAGSLQSDRDSVFGDAVHEIRGAVQRVDNPPQT